MDPPSPGGGKPAGAIAASRTQFAALQSQIQDLETRNRNGDLDGEGKLLLKMKKKQLAALQQKQAEGKF